MAPFDTSPLIQFLKFNHFFWVSWFLGKNLSNFVPPLENSTTRLAIVCTMYWAYLNPEVHWLVIRACNNMSRVANKVSTNPMMTDPSFFLTQYISRGENFWTWVGAHFSLVPEMIMKSIYQDRILKKCQVICLLLVSFFKEGWQTLFEQSTTWFKLKTLAFESSTKA